MKTRKEHLDWCKQRALEYCNMHDMENAFISFMSDLAKHKATAGHPAIRLGMLLQMKGYLQTIGAMQEFIEGTN